MVNKKVRNAKTCIYDGIKFRSKLEVDVYKVLVEYGLNPQYEPDKILLLNSLRPRHSWYYNGVLQLTKTGKPKTIEKKTYTPDFKIVVGDTTIYIEAKGHPNDAYPVTRKLFLHWLNEHGDNIIFSEVRSVAALHRFIKTLNLDKK